MSHTVLLIGASAAGAGVVLGWLIARSGTARIKAAIELAEATARSTSEEAAGLRGQLEEAEARARSASQQAATLRQRLEHAEGALETQGEGRKRAEEAAAKAAAESARREQQLRALKAELQQAQQRAEGLDADLQRAHSREPSDTLRVLKNDPAIGPGQFQALKLLYEQFTAKSVLGAKPGDDR